MNGSEFILFNADHPDDFYGILNAYDAIIHHMQEIPEKLISSTVRLRSLVRKMIDEFPEFGLALYAAKRSTGSNGDSLSATPAIMLANRCYSEVEKDLLSIVLDEALSKKFTFPPRRVGMGPPIHSAPQRKVPKQLVKPVTADPSNITMQQFIAQMSSLGYPQAEIRSMWLARTCEDFEVGPPKQVPKIKRVGKRTPPPAPTPVEEQVDDLENEDDEEEPLDEEQMHVN